MPKYRIVPTDPRTGKLVKSPKTYQKIRYALQGPRGGIKRIKDAPIQGFTKKDYQGINRTISGTSNFIIYEQLTNRHMRKMVKGKIVKVQKVDASGNPVFRTNAKGKKVPVYYQEKKFTFYRKEYPQRPVLYEKTKRQRELDIGFKKLSPRQQADQKLMKVVKPDTGKVIRYEVQGDTIREAMSNLMLNIDKREIYGPDGKKTAGLFYNIVTRITTPEGRVIRIPASGALATLRPFQDIFPEMMTKTYIPGTPPAFRKEVRTLANINREVALSVSHSIAKVGYRFTKVKDLRKYAGEMSSNANRLLNESKEAKATGKEKLAEKKMKSYNRVIKARDTMLKEKMDKKYLSRGKYKVEIFIEFETVPE